MNQLISKELSINSEEISRLVDSSHSDVKRSISRLASKGVIQLPPLAKVENKQSNSPNNKYDVFIFSGERGKRDSIIVVAQLSPEFTARLVDRWQELESANMMQLPDFTNPAIAARAWADKHEAVMQLESKVAADAPKVDFADRVEKSSGVLIGHFAKAIGVGPNRLFAWMRANGYLIATAGSRYNTPYQKYLERGYFDVTESSYEANGETRASFTTHITGKGQLRITEALKECGMIGEVAK